MKKQKTNSLARKQKGEVSLSLKPPKSHFLTQYRLKRLLVDLKPKCEAGEAEAIARCVEILTFARLVPPNWFTAALLEKLRSEIQSRVTSKGPKATALATLHRNWIDMQRYLIVQKALAAGTTKGKKIPKKKAYFMHGDPDLIAAGVYAGTRAIQDSCRRIEHALRQPVFVPTLFYPGDPDELRLLIGDQIQE